MNRIELAVVDADKNAATLEILPAVTPIGCLDAATAAGAAAERVALNVRAYANAARLGLQRAVRADYGFAPTAGDIIGTDGAVAGMSAADLMAWRAAALG